MQDEKTEKDSPVDPDSLGPTDTFIISNRQTLRRLLKEQKSDDLTPDREIILLVRGMTERLIMTDDLSVILGRSDLTTGYRPDVDLMPYGAQGRGVSRSHVRLHVKDSDLYVTDLGSSNGTFVGGQRLAPDEPHQLHRGDNLMLGSLSIQVVF